MKIRQILYVTLSILAVNIGLGSYVLAAATFELKESSQEISGTDSESGVAFHASLVARDRVVIDLYFGAKRIHADIHYTPLAIRIRSVSQANGAPVALSRQDILACRKLGVSLTPKINSYSRHGDALTSLLNLISSAPEGYTFNFTSGPFTNESFTSICPQIGGPGVATYRLKEVIRHDNVRVGPVCYMLPALGRCGKGGGPDPGIGWVQHFTQECLNHDVCCGTESGICGEDCFGAFVAAAPGFALATDCGTTAGKWTDNFGNTYVLTEPSSFGDHRSFTGTANITTPSCGTLNITGKRTGKAIELGAITGGGGACPPSIIINGNNTNCNMAVGFFDSSPGPSGLWSWKRTNTVKQMNLLSRAIAGPRPADK